MNVTIGHVDGILLINKQKNWTSFDVVAKVRGLVRKNLNDLHENRGFCTELQGKELASSVAKRTSAYVERATQLTEDTMHPESKSSDSSAVQQGWRCKCRVKVGHAGTLDPLATGLLIVLVGKMTKKQDEFMKQDKVYEVELILGKNSTTGDDEGEKTIESDVKPDLGEVESTLESFVGEQLQIPPLYSAIKIDGQRAYKLARAGKTVELEPRKVNIYSITNMHYSYPTVNFTCKVSSGTYIRSLVKDLGTKLGTGAYMSGLKRTQIGSYNLIDAKDITDESLLSFISID